MCELAGLVSPNINTVILEESFSVLRLQGINHAVKSFTLSTHEHTNLHCTTTLCFRHSKADSRSNMHNDNFFQAASTTNSELACNSVLHPLMALDKAQRTSCMQVRH
jgi:hypothetical protein